MDRWSYVGAPYGRFDRRMSSAFQPDADGEASLTICGFSDLKGQLRDGPSSFRIIGTAGSEPMT